MSDLVPIFSLVGNPNSGKSALFNALTGGRAKVGNYPGVTVERKEGVIKLGPTQTVRLFDLPGTYSLDARTPDEEVTRRLLLAGSQDAVIAVVDACNLERGLAFVLELKALNSPIIVVLNMIDLARSRGLELDIKKLSLELDVPVVLTDAVHKEGLGDLLSEIEQVLLKLAGESTKAAVQLKDPSAKDIQDRFKEVDRILAVVTRKPKQAGQWTDRIDRIVLHPFWGILLLLAVLSLIFQAIFAWAQVPMGWIESLVGIGGHWVEDSMSPGPLRSLLVDGVFGGVGAVLVFLPQILILFMFILFLEDSGYLPRAAFLMDQVMGKVGLHGRAFIPLLSSHACAIPGIMAARTIENRRDRLITIMVSPLMTCSARLPVYALLIAAFIPNKMIWGGINLQGVVMLGLYLAGVVVGLLAAFIFRRTILKGEAPALLMELPTYKWPSLKNIVIGLLERVRIFVRRAGTVILSVTIVLWFLASYPSPPEGATEPAIYYSLAGKMGHWMEGFFRPIGFDWKIAMALVPGFAAREVMIGALATVYAVEDKGSGVVTFLAERLSQDFSMATGLSLLVWYVLSCQCLSTLAVTRRETNSWRWPALMLIYMTGLAYGGSFLTYRFAVFMGLG